MKFQLLKNLKCCKMNTFLAFKLSYIIFTMLINVKRGPPSIWLSPLNKVVTYLLKMPTIVGILTYMSIIDFMLNWFEPEKKFYNLGFWYDATPFVNTFTYQYLNSWRVIGKRNGRSVVNKNVQRGKRLTDIIWYVQIRGMITLMTRDPFLAGTSLYIVLHLP